MSIKVSSTVTLWVNRVIAAGLVAMIFLLDPILDKLNLGGHITLRQADYVLYTYFCCVPALAAALWNIDILLRAILRGEVFTHRNVSAIRVIRWCCLAVSIICVPAAFAYMPLIWIVVIMGFLCLVVSVLVNVMKAAVAIREENDLTI